MVLAHTATLRVAADGEHQLVVGEDVVLAGSGRVAGYTTLFPSPADLSGEFHSFLACRDFTIGVELGPESVLVCRIGSLDLLYDSDGFDRIVTFRTIV